MAKFTKSKKVFYGVINVIFPFVTFFVGTALLIKSFFQSGLRNAGHRHAARGQFVAGLGAAVGTFFFLVSVLSVYGVGVGALSAIAVVAFPLPALTIPLFAFTLIWGFRFLGALIFLGITKLLEDREMDLNDESLVRAVLTASALFGVFGNSAGDVREAFAPSDVNAPAAAYHAHAPVHHHVPLPVHHHIPAHHVAPAIAPPALPHANIIVAPETQGMLDDQNPPPPLTAMTAEDPEFGNGVVEMVFLERDETTMDDYPEAKLTSERRGSIYSTAGLAATSMGSILDQNKSSSLQSDLTGDSTRAFNLDQSTGLDFVPGRIDNSI